MGKIEVQKALQKTREEMIGRRYRHFKGGIYVVLTIAVHSESDESLVVYQALDRPDLVWARPISMFLSNVDHKKYPDVKQEDVYKRQGSDNRESLYRMYGCGRRCNF